MGAQRDHINITQKRLKNWSTTGIAAAVASYWNLIFRILAHRPERLMKWFRQKIKNEKIKVKKQHKTQRNIYIEWLSVPFFFIIVIHLITASRASSSSSSSSGVSIKTHDFTPAPHRTALLQLMQSNSSGQKHSSWLWRTKQQKS